jgi:putative N-acetylmannosamine-6-phosphate epimerase
MSTERPHRRLDLAELHDALLGGLVVSCQPVDHGPMDDDATVVRMARAAVAGGAVGLRIEGARRLACVRAAVDVPLVGIVKRDLAGSPVRITPFVADVAALLAAGADIVAVDVTARARPDSVADLLAAIRAGGAHAMADASCETDALTAWALGFPIVGTTLSGYTGGAAPAEPDLALVARLSQAGCRVMAEGRYDTPARAAAAVKAGAWAVTVGSALTRLEVATGWFATALGTPGIGENEHIGTDSAQDT